MICLCGEALESLGHFNDFFSLINLPIPIVLAKQILLIKLYKMRLLVLFHHLCEISLKLIEVYVENTCLRILANPGSDGNIVHLLRLFIITTKRFLDQANNLVELLLVGLGICLTNVVVCFSLDLDCHVLQLCFDERCGVAIRKQMLVSVQGLLLQVRGYADTAFQHKLWVLELLNNVRSNLLLIEQLNNALVHVFIVVKSNRFVKQGFNIYWMVGKL